MKQVGRQTTNETAAHGSKYANEERQGAAFRIKAIPKMGACRVRSTPNASRFQLEK